MSVTRPTGEAHQALGMSVLLFAGGAMGYARGKSVPSLVAGVTFGSGYLASAFLVNRGDGRVGHGLGFLLSSTLAGVMGLRFARTKKFMPAGLLAGSGALTGAYSLKKVIDWW